MRFRTIAVLDLNLRLTWDIREPKSIKAARAAFDAWRAEGREASADGRPIEMFDTAAQLIIMAPDSGDESGYVVPLGERVRAFIRGLTG